MALEISVEVFGVLPVRYSVLLSNVTPILKGLLPAVGAAIAEEISAKTLTVEKRIVCVGVRTVVVNSVDNERGDGITWQDRE